MSSIVYNGKTVNTVGAITGSIVGVMYGKDNIPEKWISQIKKLDELISLGDAFVEHSKNKLDVIYSNTNTRQL